MTKESATKVENMEWQDGHYTGEVSDGVPHGQGELDSNKPVEYRPGWKGSGDDETDEAESDEYIGQIRLGMEYKVEHHAYTWDQCGKYVGEFKRGLPDGEGTLTILDGSMYVGQFKDGKWHGEGTWTHPDGDEISGQWKEGRVHGQARWKEGRPDVHQGEGDEYVDDHQGEGDEYVGEFKDGLRHGKGTFTRDWGVEEFGEKYVGDWEDDHEDGHGVITYPTRVYEGEVLGGDPDGYGLMTYEDGSSFEGYWVLDDQPVWVEKASKKWEGTETDKDGNITATFREGVRTEIKKGVMKHFLPEDSDYFGVLEKITTIIPEGRQLIIGDPVYRLDDTEVEDSENPHSLPPDKLVTRISLPESTESIGVFEVSSRAALDEVYGYYLEFIEPDPNGQGYTEQHIAELPVDSATLIACDETSAGYVLLEETSVRKFDWTFHHKPLVPPVGRSSVPRATFLDDGNVRGILIETGADGVYDVHAVYEGDHNQDSVIGILVITTPFGVGDI